ncbi:histidine phosphatase family protein [Sporolactobacillus spathodeae]
MMKKTELYVVRHGKTIFNLLDRVQGWSDTPLTEVGRENIRCLGKGLEDVPFVEAYSSDSGRAIETTRIILEEQETTSSNIKHSIDSRLREWCFGSFEGAFNDELRKVLPTVTDDESGNKILDPTLTFEKMAELLQRADKVAITEPYEKIKRRVLSVFAEIAKRTELHGGGNVLIVSHGLTIIFLLTLIDPSVNINVDIPNGSVTHITYENAKFEVTMIGDTSFIKKPETKPFAKRIDRI